MLLFLWTRNWYHLLSLITAWIIHNILYETTLPNLISYVNNVYLHWFDDKMLRATHFDTTVNIVAIQSALGEH